MIIMKDYSCFRTCEEALKTELITLFPLTYYEMNDTIKITKFREIRSIDYGRNAVGDT